MRFIDCSGLVATVVREVLVGADGIAIRHSIPTGGGNTTDGHNSGPDDTP